MRRLLFYLAAGLLLAGFPLTCHIAPRLLEAVALAPPPQSPLARELEALRRQRVAELERVRAEADARGEDGLAAYAAEAERTWPAWREKALRLCAEHGQAPPAWLADRKSLSDW
jgi:hypothetical protein